VLLSLFNRNFTKLVVVIAIPPNHTIQFAVVGKRQQQPLPITVKCYHTLDGSTRSYRSRCTV